MEKIIEKVKEAVGLPQRDTFLLGTHIRLGCDPELFLARGGQVIGSEQVVPEAGIGIYDSPDYWMSAGYTKVQATEMAARYKVGATPSDAGYYTNNPKKIVLDGVQIEFHPTAQGCRALIGNEMASIFKRLQQHIDEVGDKDLGVNFRSVVEVPKEEMAKLSAKSKLLGCAPSLNTYDAKATISAGAADSPIRSAGGHIHLNLSSLNSTPGGYRNFLPPDFQFPTLVPALDLVVGNTAVLLDRDPLNAERRKTYGRAGEHRLPAHGLEYRVLSNFWLRSYGLMSLMFGLTRLTVEIACTHPGQVSTPFAIYPERPTMVRGGGAPQQVAVTYVKPLPPAAYQWDGLGTLMKGVDQARVAQAINTNDAALALRNYNDYLRPFLRDHVSHREAGLDSTKLDLFDQFLAKVDEKGIEFWFPEDPLTHWVNLKESHTENGWEKFLHLQVPQGEPEPLKLGAEKGSAMPFVEVAPVVTQPPANGIPF